MISDYCPESTLSQRELNTEGSAFKLPLSTRCRVENEMIVESGMYLFMLFISIILFFTSNFILLVVYDYFYLRLFFDIFR